MCKTSCLNDKLEFKFFFGLSGRGLGVGWGGCLFEAQRLLTFSAFRMDTYSRWALIRGWALIQINTVVKTLSFGVGLARL